MAVETVEEPQKLAPPVADGSRSHSGSGHATERQELLERTKRIQDLMERIERLPSPAARALLQECLESLLIMYGDGLARIMALLRQDDSAKGEQLLEQLQQDAHIRGLLLIHGLHPLSLESRLRQALDQVRPYMQSHGGTVELLSLDGDFARLRLEGSCKSCPSSRMTLELAVRKALEENCPDLVGFEVENSSP